MRHYVTYTGSRTHDAAEPSDVFRIEPGKEPTRIDWRLDLINHSPNGLSWGYSGSAPAQCALAILADFLEDNDALAVRLHQDFKLRFVARFPAEWRLGGRTIRRWLTGGGADKEERLQPRVVLNVVEADGVYQATLDPCGHEVSFATQPPKTAHCGECINELVESLRKDRPS